MDFFPVQVGVPYRELKPLFRYGNDAFKLKCFADMRHIYPNMKEWTESAAAFDVVRNKVQLFDLDDSEVNVIAVADGASPRTAAMFAFRSAWNCLSIDPQLRPKSWKTKRVRCIPKKIGDCDDFHCDKLVIAAVHSHADLRIAVKKFTARQRIIIAIPCCYPQELDREPDLDFVDIGIWSPKNRVKVWIDE